MTCPDYKGLMMGYLDNELDEHQKKMFTEHLDQCP
ncbi:MAG: anti-sigma factor family protein, partial [Planctomycetota bacterium]